MARSTTLIASIALAWAAGCALIVDTSGLSTGAPPAIEAGPGAGDASRADGSSTKPDAAVDGGGGGDAVAPYEPCPKGAILCDDFEGTSFAKWSVLVATNGGTVALDSTVAQGGARSARMRVVPSQTLDGGTLNAGANVQASLPPSSAAGRIVVRTWIYIPEKFLDSVTTILKLRSDSTGSDVSLKLDSSARFVFDPDTPKSGPSKVSTATVEIRRWHCVEWRTTVAAAGRTSVLLDGVSVLEHTDDLSNAGTIDFVQVGFTETPHATTPIISYDDVAIGESEMPCPARPP